MLVKRSNQERLEAATALLWAPVWVLGISLLVVGGSSVGYGQTTSIPQGLVSSQAATSVIGQNNFSNITSGAEFHNFGSISGFLIVGNKLIVADASYLAPPNNNRLLIFNDFNGLRNRPPQQGVANADIIVGQSGPGQTAAGTGANQMNQPVSVASDGTRLFVAEWGNHRVLIFNRIPEATGTAADVVIGQASFGTATFGAGRAALRRPNGVATDGTRLFISDTLNNRVLIYNSIPTQNGAPADVEIGQPNFDTFTRLPTAANTLFDPMSAMTDGQRLIVTDFGNNRVLIYNSIPTQNGASANVVVGQPDFVSSAAGNTATSLNFPRYAYSDGTRLLIVDSGNNRILIYNQIPTTNGAAADIVLGQEDFLGLLESCAASNFAVPFLAASRDGVLYISDAFNRRILGFRPGTKMVEAVVNAASFSRQPQTAACEVVLLQPPVAPGGIATVFGTDLASTTQQADTLPLPKEMGGAKVRINGFEAPLFYVSPTQINFQVPFEVTGYSGSLEVVRQRSGGTQVSAAAPVGLANGAPGIFTWDGTGTGAGIITHADFSPVNEANPARPGETLSSFVTGLGSVDLPMTTGAAAQFAAQGSVSVSGVTGSGKTVTIVLNGRPYSYTTVEGDVISDVVTNLAALITASDPDITATADGEGGAVNLTARTTGDQGVSNTYSAFTAEGSGLFTSIASLTVVPATIEFRGTPQPSQLISVSLAGVVYSYLTVAGDTTDSVITKLAASINGDPNVMAEANTENDTLKLSLTEAGASLTIPYSISVSPPGATITLTASSFIVPANIAVGGTPGPGQIVSVFLSGTRYSYTTTASDTLGSVVSALAALVNADVNVAAAADVANLTIRLTLKNTGLNIPVSVSVGSADALAIDPGGAGVVPATLTLTGNPQAGQTATVFLANTRYAYEVKAGDTLQSIAASLASQLNADAYVSATANGAAIDLQSAADPGTLQLDAGGATAVPATLTVRGTPRPGVFVAAKLGDTRYDYRVNSDDTTDTIAAALAKLIDADARVTAVAEGPVITLALASGTTSVTLSTEITVPLSATVTSAQAFEALIPEQHFKASQGNATNDVSAQLGETLPVVPGIISFAGTVEPGQTITVRLSDVEYSYTTVAGDTLSTVATRVAESLAGDPNVAATADTAGLRVTLTLKDPNFTTKIGFSASITPADASLFALSASSGTTDASPVGITFAGPVKGTVGLYQVNFTVPSDAPDNPATKLTIFQNLIVFGSVTQFDIFSNRVTFPVKKE